MRHAVYALAVIVGAYLWADKFLFGGTLAQLFLRGWRERLKALTPQRAGRATAPAKEPEQAQAPNAGELVLCKKYYPTASVPAGASAPETVPKAAGDATFAVPKGEEPEPEVIDWRAPEFDRQPRPKVPPAPATPSPTPRKAPPLWGDANFSTCRFIPRDDGSGQGDWIEQYDQKEIRREIEVSLRQLEREQFEMQIAREAPPTENEQYELEHFDAAAYK